MRSLIILSLLAFPLFATSGTAKTIHVPADHPTIQAAIDAAGDGDTVLVAPGTYRENLTLKGKNITLASAFLSSNDPKHIEGTIVDGKSGNKLGGPVITVDKSVGPETRIVGFTLQNGDHGILNSGNIHVLNNRFIGNRDALSFEKGKAVVRSNVFEKNLDDGIDMDQGSEGVIEDNIIRDNKDDGIEIRLHKYNGPMLNIVIRRNVFSENGEDGLQLIDYPEKSDRTFRIERNLFVKNAMAAIGSMSDGNTKENYEGAELPEPVFIINNTIVDSLYGITGGDNMVLLNNIIVNTAKIALKRVHGDSAASHNLLWNNGTDFENCDLNRDTFLSKDPLLDENHKPKLGSPCIDAGTASFEYNGEKLVLPPDSYSGAAPDLGAFESGK